MTKKRKRRFSQDGFLTPCPNCKAEGERLYPDPPDIPELGTSRLPGGTIVICPRCKGAGTVWTTPRAA